MPHGLPVTSYFGSRSRVAANPTPGGSGWTGYSVDAVRPSRSREHDCRMHTWFVATRGMFRQAKGSEARCRGGEEAFYIAHANDYKRAGRDLTPICTVCGFAP